MPARELAVRMTEHDPDQFHFIGQVDGLEVGSIAEFVVGVRVDTDVGLARGLEMLRERGLHAVKRFNVFRHRIGADDGILFSR